MEKITRLPKGVWYETKRRRYRVRKYHNKVIYGPYYYRTLQDALAKMDELMEMLSEIPKERFKRSTSPTKGAS